MVETQVRTPVQSRAKRTREKLIAAGQKEFSERGYAQATASSIAERAGVATGTFYQYFRDKDALLRELGLTRTRSIGERVLTILDRPEVDEGSIDAEIRARMEGVVQAVMDYHREDPGLHAVLTERRHADPELDQLTAEFERALIEQIAELLRGLGHHPDRRATAFVLFGMVEGAVHAHVLGHPLVSDERFAQALVDSMVRIAAPTSEEME